MRFLQIGLVIAAAGLLAGCCNTRHQTYAVGPLPTQPTPADLQQADYYREVLPTELWLAPSQVSVEPAPGRTLVTVTEIHDDGVQRSIAEKVTIVNAAHPLKPVWLDFE